jgi:hypothetical protein
MLYIMVCIYSIEVGAFGCGESGSAYSVPNPSVSVIVYIGSI